jgi:hypothetical protein
VERLTTAERPALGFRIQMPEEVSITLATSLYGEFASDAPTYATSVRLDDDESLDAAIDRTVGGVLAERAARAGVPADRSTRAIFLTGLAGEVELGRVPVLDSAGRLQMVWGAQAPLSALLRARDAGLLAGDPRRIVVRLQPPTAAVGGGGFEVMGDAVEVVWKAMTALATAYGATQAIAAAKRYIERLRDAAPVLEAHGAEFDDAGIMPSELPAVLAKREWTSDDLCAALLVSREELAVLLPALGFEASPDGSWRVVDDPLARRVVGELIALASGYEALQHDHEALSQRARELLDRLEQS